MNAINDMENIEDIKVEESHVEESQVEQIPRVESKLDRAWALWYHGNNNIWDNDSYMKIANINTVEDFWKIMTCLKSYYLQNGWFFLMLDGVFPSWESNPTGGSWSFRVSKKDVQKGWNEISINITSSNLLKEIKYTKNIIGVSISPKKTFSIIKIWVDDDSIHESIHLSKTIKHFDFEDAIYRPHRDNILKEKENKLINIQLLDQEKVEEQDLPGEEIKV